MNRLARIAVTGLLGLATASALAQAGDAPRGRLLYDNHCIECHTAQVHWRDRRLATDWQSLRAWVWHWQNEARLRWSEAEVLDVTRHLNRSIYRFTEPPGPG